MHTHAHRMSEEVPAQLGGRHHLGPWTSAHLGEQSGTQKERPSDCGLPLLPQAEQPRPATSAVHSVLAPKSQGDSLFLLPEEAVI